MYHLEDLFATKPYRNRIATLVLESVDTPRVFSTKTQDFTPKFLKPVVEVHLFLDGSKYRVATIFWDKIFAQFL